MIGHGRECNIRKTWGKAVSNRLFIQILDINIHTCRTQEKNWKMMRFVWLGAWLAFFFGTSLGFGLGSPIRFLSLVGYIVYPLILYALSMDRKAVSPRTVLGGLVIQYLMALFVLKTLYVRPLLWKGVKLARCFPLVAGHLGVMMLTYHTHSA